MAQVIYNPTDRLPDKFQEKFRGHFKGVGFCIKPGEKIKVEDSLAAHMLNEFAQRGLVSLNFGDEDKIEGIIQEALRANREFKIKQVNIINQRNEERKAIGLPYLVPKGDMRLFAEELGEDLIEPYRVKDAEKQRVTEVEKENIALKERLKAMDEKLDMALKGMGQADIPYVPINVSSRTVPIHKGEEVTAREISEDEPQAQKSNPTLDKILDGPNDRYPQANETHEETPVGRLKKHGRHKKR